MGKRTLEDAEYFYSLDELSELSGYTPKRVNELAERYRKRPGPDGEARRCFYIKKERIFNAQFGDWLLEERFHAPVEVERPAGTVSLKGATHMGRAHAQTYITLWRLVRSGKLRASVNRGRYYVGREEVEALAERYQRQQAPDDWFPVTVLARLCRTRCSPPRVHNWVRRHYTTKTFLHPHRCQLVQFISISDALTYLTRALGSAHKAFFALTKHAPRYFRSLRKRTVDLFRTVQPEERTPETLDVVFSTRGHQPLPVNSSGPGHGLLSLRT